MYKGPHSGTHVYMQLGKGFEVDVMSLVELQTCTDSCTYSNQGIGLEEG